MLNLFNQYDVQLRKCPFVKTKVVTAAKQELLLNFVPVLKSLKYF